MFAFIASGNVFNLEIGIYFMPKECVCVSVCVQLEKVKTYADSGILEFRVSRRRSGRNILSTLFEMEIISLD